jgi:filamentous hemagglutinin family protein
MKCSNQLFRSALGSLALFLAVTASSTIPSPAYAEPQGGVVMAGQASIQQNGQNVDIIQQSTRAAIDWRGFNVGANERVQFIQPSSNSFTLNRVNDINPSRIDGKVLANGNILILNPNGVLFGLGSEINVNGLIATSADISNQNFMNGQLIFDRAGNPHASIINKGTITAQDAGLIGFVAPNVINDGIITARLGRVQMSSGDTATIDFYGDNLMEIAVSDKVTSQLVSNTGKISADGGRIALTAAAGKGIINSLIDMSGELKALSVDQKNGEIIISAAGSNAVRNNVVADKGKKSGSSATTVSGILNASGYGDGETGGKIEVLADNVTVKNGSTIDASGSAGGGVIRVGGDFHGEGTTPTALNTSVQSNTLIKADAVQSGNGGDIAVWADYFTNFWGKVFSRGGALSGNGGFIEVSGKQYLTFRGEVDTQAANGAAGMLLLDPADVIIANGTTDSAADGTNTFQGNATAGTIASIDAGPTMIYESELQGIAAATNISITTTNSITINDLVTDGNLNLAQTSGKSVTFSTGAGGFIMANTANTITTAGGALNITTTGGTSTIGNLTTGSGLITLNLGGTGTVSGVINNTGGLTKTGAGTLILSGTNTYSGTTTLTAGTIQLGNNSALGTSTLSLNAGTLQGDGTARTLANNMSLANNSTISGTSDLTLNGTLTNTNNRTITNNNSGITTFVGNVNLSNSATNRTLTIAGTGNTTISGIISNGSTSTASALTKSGAGTLTLSAANTYAGATTLTAGIMQLGNNSALGTGTLSLNGGTLQGDGTARTLTNTITHAAASTIAGTSDLTLNGAFNNTTSLTLTNNNSGLTTIGGAVALSNSATNRTLTIAGTGNTTISGIISNGSTSTASALTKSGAGTLTLSAANTYAGLTTVSAGTLTAGLDNALFSGGLTVSGTGTYDIGSYSDTVGAVTVSSTSGGISGTTGVLMGTSYALSNASGTATISAILGGAAVALTKSGAGTAILSGDNTYSGTTTLSAGTLRATTSANALGAGALSLGGGTLELANDTALNFGRNTTVTAATTIKSDLLTSGAGVTHTLGTLSQGTFALTGTAGNNVSSGTSGIDFGATNFTGNPTFTPGTNFNFGFGALTDGGSARTITKNGLGNIIFNAAAASWATAADVLTINLGSVLLAASNAFGTGTNTNVTVNSTTAGQTALLDLNGFNQSIGTLTLGGASGTATSVSNVSTGAGTLTLGGNVTFTNTGNPLASTISGKLDLGSATRTFTIGNSSNATEDVIISAIISGSAVGLTKAGAGTLTLSGDNTYSGTTTLSAGTLRATTSANALGAGALSLGGGTLELANDTALNFGRNTTVTAATTIKSDLLTSGAGVTHTLGTLSQGTFALTGTAGNNVSSGTSGIDFGATNFTGNPTFTPGTNFNFGFGALTDGGSARTITKNGLGNIIFNAAAASWATAADVLTINLGSVLLAASNAFGTGTNTNVTVNSTTAGQTALLDLNGFNQSIGTLTLGGASGTATSVSNVSTGAGTLTLGGNVTFTNTGNPLASTISGKLDLGSATRTFTIGNSSNATEDVIISAIISGSAVGLTKAGAGTLTLSGDNTYSGTTTLSAGTLRATTSANALGAGALSLGGGTLELANDTALNFGRNTTVTAATTIKSDLLTSGAGVTHTLGTLSQGTFALTGTAGNNVSSGTSGIDFGATNFTGNPTFTPGTNFNFGFGALTDGGSARTITKNGLGNIIFNAAAASWATAADVLTINLGSVLLAASNAFGTGTNTNVTVNSTTAGQTALLDLNGFNQSIGTLTLGGASGTATSVSNVSTGAGTLTLGGNVTFTNTGNPLASTISGKLDLGSATRTFTIGDSSNATEDVIISAIISGSAVGLTKAGAGTLTLSGDNTYSGTTTLSAGTLRLSGGAAIVDTGSVTIANAGGAILELTSSETIGSLSGGGATGGDVSLNANTLTSGDASSTSYAGIISGSGGLTKEGNGIFTLSGSNTYTGVTAVNTGTLRLGAANLISDSSALTTAAGATFDLNGFSETLTSIISSGTVTFGAGNTLTTSGVQTYNGTVTGNGNTLVSTGGGAISAANVLNDFTGNISITTTGTANIADANALNLGTVSASTFLARALGGNLTLTDQVQVTGTSGTPLTLTTSANFINSFGATALQTGAGGRWLVYSASPLTDTKGGLTYGFKQYNATYGDTVLGTANGFMHLLAPTITAGLTGTVSKTYNGALSATLSAGNYTVSGDVDGDTVTLNNPTAGTYADANAGTGKTVSVTGISATATNGAATVYGYQMASSSISDTIGTITAANLTLSSNDVSRAYNGGLAAAGSAVVTAGTLYTNVSNGSVLDSLSGGSFAFTNANAGTGKTVSVSGVTLNDGNSGGNYNVTYANNTNSTITAANLTLSSNDVSRAYNGGLAAAGSAVVTAGTLYTNVSNGSVLDSLSGGSFAFTNANAGTGKTVSVSGVTLNDGNSGGNYNVTYANNTNSTITAANLTLSSNDVSRAYNGSLAAAGSAVVTAGTLYTNVSNGSVLDSLSGGSFAFTNANAGTGKTVSVSGVTLNDGNSGGNYNVTYANNTNSTITAANLTITANNQTKIAGTTTTFFGTEFTNSTLYAGDIVNSVTLVSAGTLANASTASSPYSITASNAVGTGLENYLINYIDGLFTVTATNNPPIPNTVLAAIQVPPAPVAPAISNNTPSGFLSNTSVGDFNSSMGSGLSSMITMSDMGGGYTPSTPPAAPSTPSTPQPESKSPEKQPESSEPSSISDDTPADADKDNATSSDDKSEDASSEKGDEKPVKKHSRLKTR